MNKFLTLRISIQYFSSFILFLFNLSIFLFLIGCDDDVELDKRSGSLSVKDQVIEDNRVIIDSLTLEKAGWIVIYRGREDGSGPDLMGPRTNAVYVESGNTNNLTVSVTGLGEIEDNDRLWAMLHSDNGELNVFEYSIGPSVDLPLVDINGEMITVPFNVTLQAVGLLRADNQLISQDSVLIRRLVLRKKNGWIVARKTNDLENAPESIISEPLFVDTGEHSNLFLRLSGDSDISNGDQIQLFLHEDTGVPGVFEYDGVSGLDDLVTDIYSSTNPLEDANAGLVRETITVYSPFINAQSQLINENIFLVDEFLAASDGWFAVFLQEDGEELGDLLGYQKIDSGSHTNISIYLEGSILTEGETVIPALFVQDWNQSDFHKTDSVREFFDGRAIQIEVQTIAPSGFVEARDTVVSDNIVWTDNINGDVNGWFSLCRSNESNSGPDTSKIISQVGNLYSEDNPHVGTILREQVQVGETVYFLVHVDNGDIGSFEFEENLGFDGVIASHPIQIVEATGSIIVNDQIVQNRIIVVDDLEMNANSWIVTHPDDGFGDPLHTQLLSDPIKVSAAGLYENFEIELDQPVQEGTSYHLALYKDNGVIGDFEFDEVNGTDEQITSSRFSALSPQGTISVEDQEVSGTTLVVSSISTSQPSLLAVFRDDGSNTSADLNEPISELYSIETGSIDDLIIELNNTVSNGERLWIGLLNNDNAMNSLDLNKLHKLNELITSSFLDIEKFPPINYHVTSGGAEGFLFNGQGLSDSLQPQLEFSRGKTYTFTVDIGGRSFFITSLHTSGTYESYNKRVTNNGISSGIITFTVPEDAPDELYYTGSQSDSPGVIRIIE